MMLFELALRSVKFEKASKPFRLVSSEQCITLRFLISFSLSFVSLRAISAIVPTPYNPK